MATKTLHTVETYNTENCEAKLVYIGGILHIQVKMHVKRLMDKNGGRVPTFIESVIPIGVELSLLDVDVEEEEELDLESVEPAICYPFKQGDKEHA